MNLWFDLKKREKTFCDALSSFVSEVVIAACCLSKLCLCHFAEGSLLCLFDKTPGSAKVEEAFRCDHNSISIWKVP